MQDPDELKALISLLEDPDHDIYTEVKSKITSYGLDVVPILESAWEHFSFGQLFQNRIEEIIHEIQFTEVCENLVQWSAGLSQNLLEGLFIISSYQYPDLDREKYENLIESIVKEVWLELNEQLTVFEKINILNKVFYEFNSFRGNTTNFHSPQNSFINDVLDTKRGNPVLLACLYMIIASKVGVSLNGVNLPRHFILMISEKNLSTQFYINPFNKGGLLNKRDIDHFLKQLKVDSKPSFFTSCTNKDILKRVLHNLHHSYLKLGFKDKEEELVTLLNLLN